MFFTIGAILTGAFFIPGVIMTIVGVKKYVRARKYSLEAQAIVSYAEIKNVGLNLAENADASERELRPSDVIRPAYKYYIELTEYNFTSDNFYDIKKLPPEGEFVTVYVNPKNPNEMVTEVDKSRLFLWMGISYLVTSLLPMSVLFLRFSVWGEFLLRLIQSRIG